MNNRASLVRAHLKSCKEANLILLECHQNIQLDFGGSTAGGRKPDNLSKNIEATSEFTPNFISSLTMGMTHNRRNLRGWIIVPP